MRDALINEQWEGPRNLLLNQMHNDLQRVADWYPPRELVRDLAAGGVEDSIAALGETAERLVATAIFDRSADAAAVADAQAWDEFLTELFHGYQATALLELR